MATLMSARDNEFPYELRLAVDGLNNEYRQQILMILKDIDHLSFSEIKSKVNIKPPLLSSHLRKLTECLLIEHFYEHTLYDERFSFYRISSFGKRVVENLLDTMYVERGGTRIDFYGTEHKDSASVPLRIIEDLRKVVEEITKASEESYKVIGETTD
jgi:predicted transcriptional regulator